MFVPILLALVLIPLLEIYFLLQVRDVIGIEWTVLLLIAISIFGAWLVKREGRATWTRLRAAMARGQVPTKEAADGAMILFGGALMLTPGFITDIFGLLLILPPTRVAMKGTFRKLIGGLIMTRAGAVGRAGRGIYAAKVVSSRRRPHDGEDAVTPRSASPSVPSLEHRSVEDDSPDKA
jgi:UPF0716 protein FxsA